jgi:hypothetical protein
MEMKITSGFCFILGLGVVSWFKKKQKYVSLSYVEEKYMATGMGACDAIWLRKLLVAMFG